MAHPTRELLTYFDHKHFDLLQERAVIQGGKDAKLIAGLCASHGPDRVRELIDLFFASDDPFLVQAGYTVGVFIGQCGKLIAQQKLSGGPGRGAFAITEARAALFAMGAADADGGIEGTADRGTNTPGAGYAGKDRSGLLRRVR